MRIRVILCQFFETKVPSFSLFLLFVIIRIVFVFTTFLCLSIFVFKHKHFIALFYRSFTHNFFNFCFFSIFSSKKCCEEMKEGKKNIQRVVIFRTKDLSFLNIRLIFWVQSCNKFFFRSFIEMKENIFDIVIHSFFAFRWINP